MSSTMSAGMPPALYVPNPALKELPMLIEARYV